MTPSFPTRRSSDLLVAAQPWPHRLVEGASLLVPRVGRPVELADATVDADPRQLGHQPSADTAGTRLAGDEQVLDENAGRAVGDREAVGARQEATRRATLECHQDLERRREIGTPLRWEGVCPYGSIAGVAVSLQNTNLSS